ncbi:hypothetical protein SLEP1_g3259 [Rubroshorea leprosula]|uniref:Uncharacterized protein n=1 Tax=Rubroshorea leprosula TaxID=152421 RepID=A0AAV5HTG9_9ROSI|nr:hypothetical protein SLEP1_g3259 [Rubroshorea leprosula]
MLVFKKDERLVGSMHVSAILMIMKNGYNVKSMAILIPESNSKRFACNETFLFTYDGLDFFFDLPLFLYIQKLSILKPFLQILLPSSRRHSYSTHSSEA